MAPLLVIVRNLPASCFIAVGGNVISSEVVASGSVGVKYSVLGTYVITSEVVFSGVAVVRPFLELVGG